MVFTLFVIGGYWIDGRIRADVPWFTLAGAAVGATFATMLLVREVMRPSRAPEDGGEGSAARRSGSEVRREGRPTDGSGSPDG